MKNTFLVLITIIISFSSPVSALEEYKSNKMSRFGEYLLIPSFSYMYPGFGQVLNGQWGFAASYFSIQYGLRQVYKKLDTSNSLDIFDYKVIPFKGAMFLSDMSAYHSFQYAVTEHPEDFPFITKRDSLIDISLAPFKFSFLKRKSTYIPLLIALAMGTYNTLQKVEHYSTVKSLAVSTSLSYLAGTGEEMTYRGWLLPATHYYTKSPAWSNIISSTIFGAVHYNESNKFPIFQALMGGYLAHLTQKNGYSLQESIFLHAWWDVIIMSSLMLSHERKDFKIYHNFINFSF